MFAFSFHLWILTLFLFPMNKNINAAQILGESGANLRREFTDRQLSVNTFANLQRGRFDPYTPSEDIRARFREIARNLGTTDVFQLVFPSLRRMRRRR